MPQMRDLELLINSRYPFIAVETEEEDRPPLKSPVSAYDRAPLQSLAQVAAGREDGIYLFKDLHKFLSDPAVVRRMCDLAPVLTRGRRALVLSAPDLELPAEIRSLSAMLKLELPTLDELKAMVQDKTREFAARANVRIDVSAADLDRLANSLAGLTLFEAECRRS